jgi:hypothetical protein
MCYHQPALETHVQQDMYTDFIFQQDSAQYILY